MEFAEDGSLRDLLNTHRQQIEHPGSATSSAVTASTQSSASCDTPMSEVVAAPKSGDLNTCVIADNDAVEVDDSGSGLSIASIVDILLQVANGCMTLHESNPPIYHRDLKAR